MSNLLFIFGKNSNNKISFSVKDDVYAKLMEKLQRIADSKNISKSKVFEMWLEEKLKEENV